MVVEAAGNPGDRRDDSTITRNTHGDPCPDRQIPPAVAPSPDPPIVPPIVRTVLLVLFAVWCAAGDAPATKPAGPITAAVGGPLATAPSATAMAMAIPAPAAITPAWFDRGAILPRLAGNLIRPQPLARPIDQGYRLLAGDVVRLVTWGGTAQNLSLPIDPAGNLAIPGLGMLPVGGLTVGEAQARTVELLRSQFRQAGAVLAVEQPTGAGVTVTGEVAAPGYLALPPGGTVLEALSAAGGVLDRGSLRTIQVRRSGSGEAIPIDLYRVALDGDGAQLSPLPPGASVHVPLSGPQVQVTGAVRRPAAIELKADESLAEAVRLAGGLSATADADALRLAREGSDGQRMTALRLADLAQVPAADGDRLLIAERRDVSTGAPVVRVEGLVRVSGVHAWREGLTVGEVLAAAGGPLPGADPARAVIERLLTTPRMVDLGGGVVVPAYRDLLSAGDPTVVLQPLDLLMIPPAPGLADQSARITIEGAVARPGQLPFSPGMVARDALRLVGGPTAEAQVEGADLVRVVVRDDGSRDVERKPLDLRPLMRGESGPELQNQDTLVVRARNDVRVKVTVTGEVLNTGTFVLPRGATLSQLVAIAGGLTSDAFPQGARLFRATEAVEQQRNLKDMAGRLERAVTVNREVLASAGSIKGREALQATILNQETELVRMQEATATGRLAGLDLAGALIGAEGADLVLQPGDRIEIPNKPGTVRVIGEVMVPCSLRWEAGLRAPDVVRRAGGTTSQADEDRVFVVRADGSVVASAAFSGTEWDARSRRWSRTTISRLELQEGDTVIVPPDLVYRRDGLEIAKDLTQILFQVATTAGTVAVLAK